MKYCSILILLLFLFVNESAGDCIDSEKALPTYTWMNFFENGCIPVTEIIDKGNRKAELVYNCENNEKVTQFAKLFKIEKGVSVWASQRLSNDQLRNLSAAKCQASIVFLGSEHATIHFTCALLELIIGYDILSRLFCDDCIRIELIPVKALIIYGDGTQEFSVDEEELIPIDTFHPFTN